MSNISSHCLVCVGPTSFGIDQDIMDASGCLILPPVRRGDVEKIVQEHPPGNLAIVDGTFHSYPAVSHVELREALRAGWHIWGLCSMGAIRAYEMRFLGMVGFGKVYEQFEIHEDFRDDEVALVHSAEKPYMPITEPLVHIREFVRQMVGEGYLEQTAGNNIIERLAGMWYGFRTLRTLGEMTIDTWCGPGSRLDDNLREFSRFRIKSKDLECFLETKPWLSEA